jgi:hypothetical protein
MHHFIHLVLLLHNSVCDEVQGENATRCDGGGGGGGGGGEGGGGGGIKEQAYIQIKL